ncbi:MAG: CapA family protein [Chloroflexota bacterium]|nr:CapA family protein [Chloroflexota bacterium]
MPGKKRPVASGGSPIILVAVGDVSPDRDDPPSMFRFTRDVFQKADIAFGQMEAPLSDRGTPQFVPSAPARLHAKNIRAVAEEGAGFDVMSFAANHALDHGYEAFFDTIDALTKNGIVCIGAGKDLAAARKPAIIERNGIKVGFLAYLSILPVGFEADAETPGCNPLRAHHAYRQMNYQPGTPPLIVTGLIPQYRAAMEEDIKKLRPQVDVLVVSIHAGVFGVEAMIAMYQKEAAYAAIDCGADLVLQAHAHQLKGIEVCKGKVVFYGLGNFALEHGVGYPGRPKAKDPNFVEYDRRYPAHHPNSPKTLIVKAYIQDKKIQKVTYLPAYINSTREPELVRRPDPRATEVFEFVKRSSEAEDLRVSFSWEGDEVLISG